MNTPHLTLGRRGEDLAVTYLKQIGHKILARNWRHKRAEIDIISEMEEIVIFVEVKTRSSTLFGYPEAKVTERKRQLMQQAALAYMTQNNSLLEWRFDIIAIVLVDNQPFIEHFKDAFCPFDL